MLITRIAGTVLLACAMAVFAACPASKQVGASAPASGQAPEAGQKIAVTPPAAGADAKDFSSGVAAPPQDLQVCTFTVTGMAADSDSSKVESTLIKLPGVTTVSADWKTGIAKVQFDPAQIAPEKLSAAIEDLGYKAVEQAGDTKQAAPGSEG